MKGNERGDREVRRLGKEKAGEIEGREGNYRKDRRRAEKRIIDY